MARMFPLSLGAVAVSYVETDRTTLPVYGASLSQTEPLALAVVPILGTARIRAPFFVRIFPLQGSAVPLAPDPKTPYNPLPQMAPLLAQ